MGHERIGMLPKTKRWSRVVDSLSAFPLESNVQIIAKQTLQNVQDRFKNIERDKGVQATFQFLILLSLAAKQREPSVFLKSHGIHLSESITPLQISKALASWTSVRSDSNEYKSFAQIAAIEAINQWYNTHNVNQGDLFRQTKNDMSVWKNAAEGSGFCELSRLYFSKFTETYLKYFLEREASACIFNLTDRDKFKKELQLHLYDISQHAFQTAKITQSFAAGWFNKNVKDTLPSQKKIQGFLNIAFGKMTGELLREEKLG